MLQIKAQIDEVDAQIKAEIGVVAGAVQAQYDAARSRSR